MDQAQYIRMRRIFQSACDLPTSQLRVYLNEECAADHELRNAVETLLRWDGQDSDGLLTNQIPKEPRVPTIPGYMISRRIGEGGMGAIYEAVQVSVGRTVALKVVRPELATSRLIRRIEFESQVLGLLDHPGIARVYEAGMVEHGENQQPFFAMELLTGSNIVAHATDLALDGRLELIARVCDALHYAHQKGVIHRDLKPANILVLKQESDPVGQPKIVDFGVATTSMPHLRMTTTRSGCQLVGTIAYMSPEQIQGCRGEVDTRSDVYAVGVILYELISGRVPYELKDVMLHDALRIVSERTPDPLTDRDGSRVDGDLTTIVATSLAKEPYRRFESAAALGNDLRRHLRNEPIVARPASQMYRLRKLFRRHRMTISALALILVILTSGAVGTTLAMLRAQTRATEAVHARDEAEAITTFLESMLESPRVQVMGPELLMTEFVDLTADALIDQEDLSPLVRARLEHTLAATYASLAKPDAALKHARSALSVRADLLGELDSATQQSRLLLIFIWQRLGEYALVGQQLNIGLEHYAELEDPDVMVALLLAAVDHAIKTGDVAIAFSRLEQIEKLRFDHPTSRAMVLIARAMCWRETGDYAKCEANLLLGMETDKSDVTQLLATNELMLVYQMQSRFRESVRFGERHVEQCAEYYGDSHPTTLTARNNLALAYNQAGTPESGLDLAQATVSDWIELAGHKTLGTVTAKNTLALIHSNLGNRQLALETWIEVHESLLRMFDASHPHVLMTKNNIGTVLLANGDCRAAESQFRTTLKERTRVLGPDHPMTQVSLSYLGEALLCNGYAEEATRHTSLAVAAARASLTDSHAHLGHFLRRQGEALTALDLHCEAEDALLESISILADNYGAHHRHTTKAKLALVDLYIAMGERSTAALYESMPARDN